MMPLKRLLVVLFVFFSVVSVKAQQETADIGIVGGYGFMFSEKPSNGPSFGAFYRFNTSTRFAYRFNANYSLNSRAFNGAALFEVNFLDFLLGVDHQRFSPYLVGGVGTVFTDNFYLSLPFGAGLKYGLTDRIGVGTELMLNKTFSDKIDGLPIATETFIAADGVHNNDWVNYVGVTLWYKFYLGKKPCPTYGSKY